MIVSYMYIMHFDHIHTFTPMTLFPLCLIPTSQLPSTFMEKLSDKNRHLQCVFLGLITCSWVRVCLQELWAPYQWPHHWRSVSSSPINCWLCKQPQGGAHEQPTSYDRCWWTPSHAGNHCCSWRASHLSPPDSTSFPPLLSGYALNLGRNDRAFPFLVGHLNYFERLKNDSLYGYVHVSAGSFWI